MSAEAAFEELFERHHREIARLAFLLTGDHASADDVTSEAFLAVWRQWATVTKSDQPLAYIRRVVVNMAASRVRRLVRERNRLPLLHSGAVADCPDGGAAVDVRSALAGLPVGQRSCVVLRLVCDLTEQEVASLLGVTVGTVKSQTFKGVARLQNVLETYEPAGGRSSGAGRAASRRSS